RARPAHARAAADSRDPRSSARFRGADRPRLLCGVAPDPAPGALAVARSVRTARARAAPGTVGLPGARPRRGARFTAGCAAALRRVWAVRPPRAGPIAAALVAAPCALAARPRRATRGQPPRVPAIVRRARYAPGRAGVLPGRGAPARSPRGVATTG